MKTHSDSHNKKTPTQIGEGKDMETQTCKPFQMFLQIWLKNNRVEVRLTLSTLCRTQKMESHWRKVNKSRANRPKITL